MDIIEKDNNTKTHKEHLNMLETKILRIIYKQNISIPLLKDEFENQSIEATRDIANILYMNDYINTYHDTNGIPILCIAPKGENYILNDNMEKRLKLKSGIIGWLIGIATTLFVQFIGNLIL